MQDYVCVEGGFSGGDYGIAFSGFFIEPEALDMADLRARLVLFDNFLEFAPDRRFHRIARHDLHQAHRRVHIRIQRQQRENRVQHLRRAVAVEAHED